jgi:uncharacterized protein DUF4339
MGIKFLCPNGHKLNVKSFLSGKKAICPKCGVRVLVPQQNDPQPDQASAAEGSWTDVSIVEAEVLPAQPRVAGSMPTAPAAGDAIAEAPSAVWYVRPATGGQFGPASGEIMRGWLGEGRVGASSLVWRAGWAEWRAASAVFPQLGGPVAPPGVPMGSTQAAVSQPLAVPLVNGPAPPMGSSLPRGQVVQSLPDSTPQAVIAGELSTAVPPLPQGMRRRRRQSDSRLIASAVLTVLLIILLIIAFFMWRQENTAETTPPKQHTPDATPAKQLASPAEVPMS